VKLKIAYITDKGSRDYNEDFCSFHKDKESCCCIVADGLGGHGAGDVASTTAVKVILESFKDRVRHSLDDIQNYLEEAQRELLLIQSSNLKYKSMRTTISLLLIKEDEAVWAHLGDTRLYFFRNDKIKFQTKDHSVPQALVNVGEITAEEIRFHEDRNRLLRVLGETNSFKPKVETPVKLESGDTLLLCTDGFWEYVYEEQMEQTLSSCNSSSEWLESMEKILISHAKENNDNYTAMAVFVK
jgi:PPM family protein phosphatase